MECLAQVLEAKPDNFEATFLMGLIQQRKGKLREAQARLERAVGLKKDSSAAHASLGSLLAEVGNKQAGAETSVHGTETEAQRARAFPAGRGLLRHGTTQTRHPASKTGHANWIRSLARLIISSDCCAWK